MTIKRATQQVKETLSKVASMNPDNMASGGLMDDFDGTITKVRLVPWDYNGNIDHDVLAAAVTIQPDEGDEFTQHYSAGDLESFMPSMDGKEPISGDDDDREGIYALQVGKKEQLNNNSNWAQFLKAAIDAGFDTSRMTAEVTFLEGVYGHFNRIPQKKRSGIVVTPRPGQKEAKQDRPQEILVITEIKEAPKAAKVTNGSGKAAPAKTSAKPAGKAAKDDGDDLDDRLAAVIVEAIEAADGVLLKTKLAGIAMKAFQGPEKAKAVKRATDVAFLESRGEDWAFDADEGQLLAV